MQPESICKQIAPQLDAYHDGELVGEEKETVEKHLGTCAYCVSKLAEIDRVVHSLKTMPLRQMPEGLSAKLDNMIDAVAKGTGSGVGNVRNLRSRVFIPLAAAAAAVVALAVGINFFNGGGQTPVAHVDKVNAPQIANQPKHDVNVPAPNVPEQVAVPSPQEVAVTPEVSVPVEQHESVKHHAPHPGQEVAVLQPHQSVAHAKQTPAQAQPVAASGRNDTATTEVAVAELPSGTSTFNDAVGIATDEDGLYDIKM